MKLAASNLMLPAFDHTRLLPRLAQYGAAGLEVAPFHTWRIASDGVTSQDVRAYGRMAEFAGLKIIGLHGLTEKPLEVEKLTIGAYKAKIMAELIDLSVICRDLGGRTMILEARRRGALQERATSSKSSCRKSNRTAPCFASRRSGPRTTTSARQRANATC